MNPNEELRIVPRRTGPVEEFYANHVQAQWLPEEVYLDFCTLELDEMLQPQVLAAGIQREVPAKVRARIILSQAHARRLGELLLRSAALPSGVTTVSG